MRAAIIGASGLVGMKLIELLKFSKLGSELNLTAVSQTERKLELSLRGQPITTVPIETFIADLKSVNFAPFDIIWIASPSSVAKLLLPLIKKHDAARLVIDGSSAHRLQNIPLVIPEVSTFETWCNAPVISSPNCIATLVALALAPLNHAFNITRIQGSTYQSASGGGRALLETLIDETKSYFKPDTSNLHKAFNIYPHESEISHSGLCGEEEKIIQELRLFLNQPKLPISMRAVRVPTLHAHGIHLSIALERPFTLEDAKKILSQSPGLTLLDKGADATKASNKHEVLCSNVRLDPSATGNLELWIVGDQLLKGSALNMLQIAEMSTLTQEAFSLK